MRRIVIGLTIFIVADFAFAAQREARPPAPVGQDIVARDGDRLIIEDDARVHIVRRQRATIRTLFDERSRVLILLADFAPRPGELPDGRVDWAFTYRNIDGKWPLGARWEGLVTFEEYSDASRNGPGGIGFTTPAGLIQVFFGPSFRDNTMKVTGDVVIRSWGANGTSRLQPAMSFDDAERQQIVRAVDPDTGTPGVRLSGGIIDSTTGRMTWSSLNSEPPPGVPSPVRVGGAIRPPRKIRDAAAVYPQQARQAQLQGVVILEITVGADGFVSQAAVLRSIPVFDAAAIAAVRQWQYEPTLLNGVAVPVIMTVTVNFSP